MSAVRADLELLVGRNKLARLPELIPQRASIFVVASSRGRRQSRIDDTLAGRNVFHFSEFTPNPVLKDAVAAAEQCARIQPDLVLGIGGGSALDVAKLARALPIGWGNAVAALKNGSGLRQEARLVLVPTTAGTGSEVTSFATVYVGGKKASLDDPAVRADAACVDPALAESCPPAIAISSALDALSQGIESFLSPRSTMSSRAFAHLAIEGAVRGITGSGSRRLTDLSSAATASGMAIDITRTSLPHALSYPITTGYGVPHGIACAVFLPWFISHVLDQLSRSVDPRGAAFIERRLSELAELLGTPIMKMPNVLRGLIATQGAPTSLSAVGVERQHLPGIVKAGLASPRSENIPVVIDPQSLLTMLTMALWE